MAENELEVSVAEVVEYLRISHEFSPVLKKVIDRKVTVSQAKKLGITVEDVELQRAADVFRVTHQLQKASDAEQWLRENRISDDSLEQYLEDNLMIDKFKHHLNKTTVKDKYLSSPEVTGQITEMIYQDWLEKMFA